MGIPEGTVESYLTRQAARYNCLCYKFTSPGNNGVPDRIIIGIDANGNRHIDFIETKAPGGKPRLLQRAVHEEMRQHGANVLVIADKTAVDTYFETFQKPEKRGGTP